MSNSTISIRNISVFTLNRLFTIFQIPLKLFYWFVQILHLTLETIDLLIIHLFNLIDCVLSVYLFLFFGVLNSLSQLLLPLLDKSILFLTVLLTERVLAIHFLLKKFVEFSVVFLNVCCNFFSVRFLQGLNSFVIIFVSSQLPFEFITSPFKFFPDFLNIHFHVLSFFFAFFFKVSFFLCHWLLINFKFPLRLLSFLKVVLL